MGEKLANKRSDLRKQAPTPVGNVGQQRKIALLVVIWYCQVMQDHNEEPLNAQVFAQLTASDRAKLYRVARRQHLKPGVLVRVWLLDRLEAELDE